MDRAFDHGARLDRVETVNGLDHGSQRRGDPRRGSEGDALLAVHQEIVHLPAKGIADRRRGAAEVDADAALSDGINLEVLRPQPLGDGGEVVPRNPESFAHLSRCEPVVIVAGGGVLLVSQELLESLLLLGRASENQRELLQAQFGGHGADVRLRLRPRRMMALQRNYLDGIDGPEHAIPRLRPRPRSAHCQQQNRKR